MPFILIFCAYLIANVYMIRYARKALPSDQRKTKTILTVLFALCALAIFPEFLFKKYISETGIMQSLHFIGCSWLVFTLYMTIGLLLFDILKLFRIKIKHSFWITLAVVSGLLGYGYWNYRNPKIKNIELNTNGKLNKEITIAAVSDIHLGYGTGKEQMKEYVQLINSQNPDIIIIGGDLIDNDIRPVRLNKMQEELNSLKAPSGVFMAPGNHDYFSGIENTRKFLSETQVVLLEDSVAVIEDLGIQIAGRKDKRQKDRLPLNKLMQGTDGEKPVILIDHQPYDLQETADNNVYLQFSGHTHRGQIWPLNWLTDNLFEVSHGYVKKGESNIYVSSGLSLWGPPFRIGTESEVVVFRLK